VKRSHVVLMTVAIIATVTIAGSGIFWFLIIPDVDFWIPTSYTYQKVANDWVTFNHSNNNTFNGTFTPINCKNSGALPATFDIVVVFSGASFSTDTPWPYQQINDTAAKFAFTLNGFEEKSSKIYFTIIDSSAFTISISLTTSQGLLRIMNAQKSSTPWDRSYRELQYILSSGTFEPGLIQ
jgi:hypothetical protein